MSASDARAEFLHSTGWFDASWYVRRCPEAAQDDRGPVAHYLEFGAPAGVGPNAWIDGLRTAVAQDAAQDAGAPTQSFMDPEAISLVSGEDLQTQYEAALLADSGLFDDRFYLDNNPDVAAGGIDPLRQFCAEGWRELRKPRADFDVWWYWCAYLDPSREAINPLVHYALLGKAAGFRGQPQSEELSQGLAYPPALAPRRICLFAGYDPDGLVDDYVVALVRELSRHADVYYLADCAMQPEELDKLSPYTKGRWAERHAAYDFGSWSSLARDHVGWQVIDQYDELMLVNDSGYLLRTLDDVFAEMDARSCDWWGLQATKGIARSRGQPSNQFSSPLPIEQIKAECLGGYERDPLYDFHVGSYFLVYRRPVLRDPGFRRLLDSVHPQPDKLRIIQKYEIGLTHYLIGKGFGFDTFIENLLPFHPLFTSSHFDLIGEGYPFLKRYFLAENHYDTPGLARWKERVLELVPQASVEMFERNLLRVAAHDTLQRSFAIESDAAGRAILPEMMDLAEFVAADLATPKFDHWWAFPVCAFNDTFAGNERAVFEEVRHDPSIKKIVLTRRKRIEVDGENVVVVPLRSADGQFHLMRARQIFVKHSPARNLVFPVSPELHNVINLWHGIPLKRIGYASLDMRDKLEELGAEHGKCRAVISSSRVDTLAMAAAFYPLTYDQVWCTGLPRNDFIVRPFEKLPTDLYEENGRLENLLEGRRLILFVPTFKNGQKDAYYRFGSDEVTALHRWLRDIHAVLGVREHMADRARTYASQLQGLDVLELSDRRFPDVEILYRHAAALVTDYSSCFFDFMLTGRPMISFAYDLDRYTGEERGLFYDMEQVFPGPVCRDFAQLLGALGRAFDEPTAAQTESYAWKRRLFFQHTDDQNAWRVVKRVKQLYIRETAAASHAETA